MICTAWYCGEYLISISFTHFFKPFVHFAGLLQGNVEIGQNNRIYDVIDLEMTRIWGNLELQKRKGAMGNGILPKKPCEE